MKYGNGRANAEGAKMTWDGWIRARFLFGAVLFCWVDVAGASPMFMGLGELPGGEYSKSSVRAVSGDGTTVVGIASINPTGLGLPFRWTQSEGMQSLHKPNVSQPFGAALGVSRDGSVVVGAITEVGTGLATRWSDNGATREFVFDNSFDHPSFAEDVTPDGSIVVGWDTRFATGPEVFVWNREDGSLFLDTTGTTMGNPIASAMSDDGSVIVGKAISPIPGQFEAFRWTAEGSFVGLGVLGGSSGVGSRAVDVSGNGAVVVGQASGLAFRWTKANQMEDLGNLLGFPTTRSVANGVSANGSRIVGSATNVFGTGAFIWDEENGMLTIASLLSAAGVNFSGWTLTTATGISDDGNTIVGNGWNPDGNFEGWIATVPEPSTGFLLAFGLVVLCRKQTH